MLFDRTRSPNFSLLKACAFGSGLAGLFLLLMPLVEHSFTRDQQIAIWSGTRVLNSAEMSTLASQVLSLFSLASFYLIGHFLMWMGYAYIASKRFPLLASVIFLVGCLSTFTDVTELGLRAAMVKGAEWNIHSSPGMILSWWALREFSIWIIYLGTVIVGIAFLGRSILNWTVSALVVFGLLTIPCMYFFKLPAIWFTWLILWHLISAAVIYKVNFERDMYLIEP